MVVGLTEVPRDWLNGDWLAGVTEGEARRAVIGQRHTGLESDWALCCVVLQASGRGSGLRVGHRQAERQMEFCQNCASQNIGELLLLLLLYCVVYFYLLFFSLQQIKQLKKKKIRYSLDPLYTLYLH